MTRKTPEGRVKDMVKKVCAEYGIWQVMIVPSAYGKSTGVSDFQILHKGVFIVVETKAPSNVKGPTPNQKLYMKQVEDNGGYAFVVRRREDMDVVLEVLGLTNT